MKCPIDGNTLTMSERSGIEIDYCPSCRGVWLDRGELDKILERATSHEAASPVAPAPTAAAAPSGGPVAASAPAPRLAWSGDRKRSGYHGSSYGHSGHGRKKHWLSEIFD